MKFKSLQLLIVFAFTSVLLQFQPLFAQTLQKETPKGWHLLDKIDSGYWGISLDKAYLFLKANNKKKSIDLWGDFRFCFFDNKKSNDSKATF